MSTNWIHIVLVCALVLPAGATGVAGDDTTSQPGAVYADGGTVHVLYGIGSTVRPANVDAGRPARSR